MANYTVNTLLQNTKLVAHKIKIKDIWGNSGQVAYIRVVNGTNPKFDKIDIYILQILEECFGDNLKHFENEFVPNKKSLVEMRNFLKGKYVAQFDVEVIQQQSSSGVNQAGQSLSKYDIIFKIYSKSVGTQKSLDGSSYRKYIKLSNHEWADFVDALDNTFCQYHDFFYDASNKPYTIK